MGGVGDQTLVYKRIVFVAFARSISQTLSVFSASFWPEWRANNCRRGNVRGLGNLHAANFAKLHRGSSAHLHKCNQKGGIKLGYLGRSFCRRTFLREARFVKVPFIAALFQPLGPKLILVLKITQRDLDYVFWKGAENPPTGSLFFIFAFFALNTDTPLAGWCKIPQNLNKMQNPRL